MAIVSSFTSPVGNVLNSLAEVTVISGQALGKSIVAVGEILEASGQEAKGSVESNIRANKSKNARERAQNFDAVMSIGAKYNFTPVNAASVWADIVSDL